MESFPLLFFASAGNIFSTYNFTQSFPMVPLTVCKERSSEVFVCRPSQSFSVRNQN
jgi:hypothetical protein